MQLSMDSTASAGQNYLPPQVTVVFPSSTPSPLYTQQYSAHNYPPTSSTTISPSPQQFMMQQFVSPASSGASTHSYCSGQGGGGGGGASLSLPACSEHSSIKRGRDDSDSYSDASSYQAAFAVAVPSAPILNVQQAQPPQSSSPAKKTRGRNYRAPRQVPKNSLLSAMGTLAAGTTPASINNNNNGVNHGVAQHQFQQQVNITSNNMRVHLRRQLSGSKLESYIGNHDSMDVDNTDSRPRSMSF